MRDVMRELQESAHGVGFDYERGSPHLAHSTLRNMIIEQLRNLVAEQFVQRGQCRVLEVGAGHGSFTDHVLAAGASVTVTEMSRPSLQLLSHRYRNNPRVRPVFDPGGRTALQVGEVDLVLCVSVLHHIPDYLAFVAAVTDQISSGGAFASFQDPTWYPRRTSMAVRADRALYLAWRVHQGDLRRGVQTQTRRFRGQLDETQAADMSEYHVLRDGVDELALRDLLAGGFGAVDVATYFSTQGRWMQRIGERLLPAQTFSLTARQRH